MRTVVYKWTCFLNSMNSYWLYAPNYNNLHFSTSTDTLHIHYKAKLASLHSTCMAMLTINDWILHLIFTPCSSVPLLSVEPWPLSFTLAYHTFHAYGLSLTVKVCALAACSPPWSVCLYWTPVMHRTKLPTTYTRYFALWMQLLPAH